MGLCNSTIDLIGTYHNIDIYFSDKTVYLNGNSKVLGGDYSATNGVSHVVDTLLIPPSLNLVELATSLNTTTLVQLLRRTGLDDTIATKGKAIC